MLAGPVNWGYLIIYKYLQEISSRQAIFSSPEPKAQGELIVWDSMRRPSVRAPVHTFKHNYLCNQQADRNHISSGASLGWGIDCIKFWVRSDQNSGFHGNR